MPRARTRRTVPERLVELLDALFPRHVESFICVLFFAYARDDAQEPEEEENAEDRPQSVYVEGGRNVQV